MTLRLIYVAVFDNENTDLYAKENEHLKNNEDTVQKHDQYGDSL